MLVYGIIDSVEASTIAPLIMHIEGAHRLGHVMELRT
jgi:hypothetical protein